jgi:hypothetical protein
MDGTNVLKEPRMERPYSARMRQFGASKCEQGKWKVNGDAGSHYRQALEIAERLDAEGKLAPADAFIPGMLRERLRAAEAEQAGVETAHSFVILGLRAEDPFRKLSEIGAR